MKVGEIIKRITADGWILVRTKGDHRQYKHAKKPGLVTIAGHSSDEVDR
jgi:predicted RNA binding protein YcfA (HicA-like mRNA interferase family)